MKTYILSENQFAISDCLIPSLLPVRLQLLHSSRLYKSKAPLSAAAFFFISLFYFEHTALKPERLELDSGDHRL